MASDGEGDLPAVQCPRCGRPAAALTGGICAKCMVETREMLRVPEIHLTVCRDCLSYREGAGWRRGGDTLERTILGAVRQRLTEGMRFTQDALSASTRPGGPMMTDIMLGSPRIAKNRVALDAAVEVEGLLPGGESLELPVSPRVSLERSLCRACGLRRSDFYEAILQVRANGRTPDDSELEAVDSLVLDRTRATEPTSLSYVSRTTERKEGRDYYLASVAFARELARGIQATNGGSIVESRKLVGVEKGTNKRLYKFTVLLRLPRLRPGDVVEERGALRTVVAQKGRRATLVNLEGARTVHEEGKGAELTLISRREDVGEALVLEVRPDGILILDPRSSQTFDLEPRPAASAGGKVRIIWRDGVPELAPTLPEEGGS